MLHKNMSYDYVVSKYGFAVSLIVFREIDFIWEKNVEKRK